MIGSRFLMLGLSLLGGYRALALPAPDGSGQAPFDVDIIKPDVKSPRPLVIWHGLGDTAHAEGISEFIDDIKKVHRGIYVHSVQIPEGGTLDDERKAGFFGNMTAQGDEGCEQLRAVEELQGGFDAIGFSQGGLYLRHYAQYCNDPPIRNLITFGTPHFGISALIPCPTPPTLTCLLAARAARLGIYGQYAQGHLIQAQYYRDVDRLEDYMDSNQVLRDLNAELRGESSEKRQKLGRGGGAGEAGLGWKERGGGGLGGLENLVAIMFDADRTVSPAESAHFGTYPPGNKTGTIIPMEDQPLYTSDWIGLKALDQRGGVRLEHCPGEHMDLDSGDCAMRMVRDWVGWA